jgi:hypothetical protein
MLGLSAVRSDKDPLPGFNHLDSFPDIFFFLDIVISPVSGERHQDLPLNFAPAILSAANRYIGKIF